MPGDEVSHTPERLWHSTLREGRGLPPGDAALSDRQRVGVLLQAGSLLCHLQVVGEHLTPGWESALVDGRGMLSGLRSVAGPMKRLPQRDLRDLARALFRADEEIAGRGEARRSVRLLLTSWEQELAPISPNEMVGQILETARFLWHSSMGGVRSTLAARHLAGGSEKLWVAGPEWFRDPLLAGAVTMAELEDRLASDEAEVLWRGGRRDPQHLTASGRWRSAVAAWRIRSRDTPDERLEFSRALFAVGRFREALAELHHLRRLPAAVLRVRCLHRLGELRRATREIKKLESTKLEGELLLEAAAVAVRLFGNQEDADGAARWVRRALTQSTDAAGLARAELTAFAEAWDRADVEAMERHLEAARPALDFDRLAWRWHKARGLHCIGRGDGHSAVSALVEAMQRGRRRLTPLEAGDLWNELALARSLAGDLAGAERALLHTLWLHREVEGPRKTTLALFNLAEVRLRRGRLKGVREIIEQSSRENRNAGNWRGIVHDVELSTRYLLVRGRPSAAVEKLEEVSEEFAARNVVWHRAQLLALKARALGWLGRAEEAAAELAAAGEEGPADFEPEERPALWALAGDRERALESIADGDAAAPIWTALLTGGEPASAAWEEAESLDAYRLARLVFDLEMLEAGWVPAHLLRRAAAVLRRTGAGAQAEQLEHRETGSWDAVATYLQTSCGSMASIERLFRNAGYAEARVVRRTADGDEQVLVGGAGGAA
ncbi:MAG: hypothetical protein OEM62_11360, partial [Acidobacteriota bacterium]|nr:hypothetical protein [Acidobacteriota bacterium]